MTNETEFRTREVLVPAERKILTFDEATEKVFEFRQKGLTVVLAQGNFDIVHVGHLSYLRLAREKADLLFVGLESDEAVKLNKGEARPYNSLEDRMNMVAEFQSVDYVFPFDDINGYQEVSPFVSRLARLKPNMLAVSNYDPLINNKKQVAVEAGVEILIVNDPWVNSTTRLARLIGLE